MFGAPLLLQSAIGLYGRSGLADRLPPPANVVISNVPGPQAPLYLAGAKVLTLYPVSIPSHGMALNLTVQSYCGALDFGLTACRRTVPELGKLAGYLEESLLELHDAVMGEAPVAVAATSVRAPSPRARPSAARSAVPTKPRTVAAKPKSLPPKPTRAAKAPRKSV